MKLRAILLVSCCLFLFNSCMPLSAFFRGAPSRKDYKHSKTAALQKSVAPFTFHKSAIDYADLLLVDDRSKNPFVSSTLRKKVEQHDNYAFLIIRNDTILTEIYKEGIDKNALHPSYSVAKSFTSALVGIAIDEGLIKSEEELVLDYIPELEGYEGAANLKIKHLLKHTSGFDEKIPALAHLYYGRNVWKGIRKLQYIQEPGISQRYINANTQLLGIILERVTGNALNHYLSEKLWSPLGMESDAVWSTDKNGVVKSFCCLHACARDFAKLGRLYLNNGNWNGQQIVSENWVTKSVTRDTSEGGNIAYGYSWRIGLDLYGDFLATGLYKQYIYVCPQKNLVIVSLCDREKRVFREKADWINTFREIADQL